SVWFYDKRAKQVVFRQHTIPCPLELASTVNRVWSTDAKVGFTSGFQRSLSVSDAYDIFIGESALARKKAGAALEILVRRMSVVLARLGAVKATRSNWTDLSDTVRWQSLKTIALLGILLRQLNQQ